MSFRDDAFLGLFRTTHTKKSLSLSPLHLRCVLSVFWHEQRQIEEADLHQKSETSFTLLVVSPPSSRRGRGVVSHYESTWN